MNNKSGVALIMVLGTIALLAGLLGNFTFETYINKYKVYNAQERIQAKLNAEAGIKIAMARLKLYKEARNLLDKNKQAQSIVKGELLDQIWSLPLVFPIPLDPRANVIQKTAVEDFSKNSVLLGELIVTIENLSNKININLLRISSLKKKFTPTQGATEEESTPFEDENTEVEGSNLFIESELIKLLQQKIDQKKETDEFFANRAEDLDASKLIKELKFFISDKDSYEEAEKTDIESEYSNKNINPKHAQLSSLSELHLLLGWTDEVIELIQDSITVHGVASIDLNKITKDGLLFIFPELEDEQIKEFFEFKNDPEDPKYFNSVNDFKSYFTQEAGIISASNFDKRVKEFEKAGIKFGTAGSLFRIKSSGKFNRANYTLTAYATMPLKPYFPPKKQTPQEQVAPGEEIPSESSPSTKPEEKAPPIDFLEPRIVELIIN